LRAAGQNVKRAAGATVTLSAQERKIAELAAAGQSNKQIAAQLFLSSRTVGAHLYRTFPKLGITSRAGLARALADLDTAG
jgi:DNA-binding NarL/FixJ family response regulator